MLFNVGQAPNVLGSVLGSKRERDDFPALADLVDQEGARVPQTEVSQVGEVTAELTRSLLANVQCWNPQRGFYKCFKSKTTGGQIGSFHHACQRDRTGVKLSRQHLYQLSHLKRMSF